MSNQKISVIVPVYNAEKYLRRCVDSILAQTFTDFELLLIDDGSKDKSGEICDEYAKNDNRVRVFHKENGGVSSARNLGICNANGELICFCDSDDWVKKDFILEFEMLSIKGGDLLSQGFHAIDWLHKGDKDVFETDKFYKDDDFFPFLFHLLKMNQLGYIWCKAFKSDIIKKYKIYFNEKIHVMEDIVFVLQYCKYITTINNSSKCYYQYRYTPIGKTFSEQNNFDVFKDLYCSLKEIDKDYRYGEKIKSHFINNFIESLICEKFSKKQLKNNITFFICEFGNYMHLSKTNNRKNHLFKIFFISSNFMYVYFMIKLFRLFFVLKSK